MKYYRNTLNCYRLPAANANAMQLRTPDMRKSQNRNLCISAKIPLYRTYVALSTVLPRGLCGFALAYSVATLSKTKLCLKHFRQPM